LLWIGAFVSFTGSRIENLAQGYFVFNLTHNEQKLAFVTFAWSIPVFLFGLVAGSFSDHFDKRAVLIWTQVIFTITACYLATATYFGFVAYWHIVLVSFINVTVSCIEMPARQSIVSRVVPSEELAAAVPVNAMTFNVARILGPVIGGIVLSRVGVSACYLVNGISFFALIWTGVAIRSDLKSMHATRGPLGDIVFEGALFTFRDRRLRTLFLLEAATACFGLAYLPMLPAYVQDVLRVPDPRAGLASAYTWVGIGALTGLLVITQIADNRQKGSIIRFSMTSMGLCLLVLGFTRNPILANGILSVLGFSAMLQLNTTNALFQLLSPDRLRGRVLAMHIWAINGLSPFGVLSFGWLARTTKGMPLPVTWLAGGVPLGLECAGAAMLIGATASLFARRGLSNLVPLHATA
jgi:MFS family permease